MAGGGRRPGGCRVDVGGDGLGHARGAGDKGAPSTFLKFRISGEQTWVDIYRGDTNGVMYQLRKTVELD